MTNHILRLENNMHDFFMPLKHFTMEDLFDGRMSQYGIRETVVAGLTSAGYRCLTKDSAFVWVKSNNYVMYFGCGRQRPYFTILAAISEVFDTVIYAEKFSDDPRYTSWGPISVASIAAWENETTSVFEIRIDGTGNEWDIARPSSTLKGDVDRLRRLLGNVRNGIVTSKRDLASGRHYKKKVWPTIRMDQVVHHCCL